MQGTKIIWYNSAYILQCWRTIAHAKYLIADSKTFTTTRILENGFYDIKGCLQISRNDSTTWYVYGTLDA